MSEDIINFKENTPHLSGLAKCLICKFEFTIVAPLGEIWFECPKCEIDKAVLIYPMEWRKPHWKCPCGNYLFYMTPDSIYCPNCGLNQKGF